MHRTSTTANDSSEFASVCLGAPRTIHHARSFPLSVFNPVDGPDASTMNTMKQWNILARGAERATYSCDGVGYRPPFSLHTLTHTRTEWVLSYESKPAHTDSFAHRLPIENELILGSRIVFAAKHLEHRNARPLRRYVYILRANAQSKAHSVAAAHRKRIQ